MVFTPRRARRPRRLVTCEPDVMRVTGATSTQLYESQSQRCFTFSCPPATGCSWRYVIPGRGTSPAAIGEICGARDSRRTFWSLEAGNQVRGAGLRDTRSPGRGPRLPPAPRQHLGKLRLGGPWPRPRRPPRPWPSPLMIRPGLHLVAPGARGLTGFLTDQPGAMMLGAWSGSSPGRSAAPRCVSPGCRGGRGAGQKGSRQARGSEI